MNLKEYEQEFFADLENGASRRNGIRRALEAALEKQDHNGAMELYHELIREDIFHCDNQQAILVFPEYLSFFESHPELQKEFKRDVMWCFKWIINNMDEFYQISLTQIDNIFEQYAAFCRKYNYSLRTYYEFLSIFIQNNCMPGEAFRGLTAKEAFQKMLKTKRDALSDCPACELDREFDYYLNAEDNLEKALEVIEPVFSGRLYCAEVPETTYSNLSVYYFDHGKLNDAVKYATKSYRLIRNQSAPESDFFNSLSDTAMIIAYREPQKALKMLRDLLPAAAVSHNAKGCFVFFRAAYHVMLNLDKEGYHHVRMKLPFKEDSIYQPDNQYQISDLKDYFFEKAAFYAQKLDRRNGNSMLTDKLDKTYQFKGTRFRKPTKVDIPVFEYICEYMDDGMLPPDFSLPRKKPDKDHAPLDDGAMDGIMYFHYKPEQKELGEMENIVQLAGKGKTRLAVNKTEKFFSDPDKFTLHIADNLQNYIISHRDELNADAIYDFGISLLVSSKNYEAVKTGLMILEIFSDYNDKLLEAIMKLSACNEFTLFCIWAVQRLDNANELVFTMAKRTFGWGRIFAVHFLQPDTPEIREWLLNNGVHNSIHPGYLANKLFDELDIRSMLRQNPDASQMKAIAYIILFLLEEGPASGIRAYDDAEDILSAFLENAERLDVEQAEIDDENYPHIVEYAREYLEEEINGADDDESGNEN